jgi:hypothetical protein
MIATGLFTARIGDDDVVVAQLALDIAGGGGR